MPQPSATRVARRFLAAQRTADLDNPRNGELEKLVHQLYPAISRAYQQVKGQPCSPPPLVIRFGRGMLQPGAIAKHTHPTDDIPHSTITVSPEASGDYLVEVVKHELIHYVLGKRPRTVEEMHPPEFIEMAELVGLPEKYRD